MYFLFARKLITLWGYRKQADIQHQTLWSCNGNDINFKLSMLFFKHLLNSCVKG